MKPPYGRLLQFRKLKLKLLKMCVLCYKLHTQLIQVYL